MRAADRLGAAEQAIDEEGSCTEHHDARSCHCTTAFGMCGAFARRAQQRQRYERGTQARKDSCRKPEVCVHRCANWNANRGTQLRVNAPSRSISTRTNTHADVALHRQNIKQVKVMHVCERGSKRG